MKSRRATKEEAAVASDAAQMRSILTGEVLREQGLCPFVIVRARDSGVHLGYLARVGDGDVELIEARRLWRWTGGRNTLNEVAEGGVETARISEPVRQIALLDAAEILPVHNAEAIASLTRSRWDP